MPGRLSVTEKEKTSWVQFDDDLFEGGKQKRQANNYTWRVQQGDPDGITRHSLNLTAEGLQNLQESDETLAVASRAAEGELNSTGKGFFLQEGLLYCRWESPGYKGARGQWSS